MLAEDKSLVFFAIGLIFVYNICFLGSFSPIHCRITLAVLGLVCVMISVAAGFSICLNMGYEMSDAHEAMPVLMLGIGVDDMFVICNALD